MWKLPLEILPLIFSHLGNNDILQCALVCSIWKETAMPFYYENVTLDGERVDLVKKLLGLDPVERDRHFQYGKFTKKLTIEREKDEMDYIMYMTNSYPSGYQEPDVYFDKEEWILLLEYLPNIEVLDLDDSDNYVSYIQYINEAESNKFLLKIQSILTQRQKQVLQGEKYTFNDIYLAICYKYRATITCLDLEFDNLFFNFGSMNGEVITLLTYFNSLTHLTFRNTCSAELTTLDLQDACPHLVSLTYHSDYHIPDSTIKNVLDKTKHWKLDYKNLKEFEIDVPSFQKNYADYIAKNVTRHVERLSLKISKLDLYDWMDRIGYYNALSLFNSFGSVEDTRISWNPDQDYKRQYSNSKSDMTIFYSMLNALKGDNRVYCACQFSDFHGGYKSIQYNTSKNNLYFEYGLNHLDFYHTGDTDLSSRMAGVVLPDYSMSTIGPEIINSMVVNIHDAHSDLLLKFLQHALTNCPNLEYFLYKSMKHPRCDICICTDIHSLGTRRKGENKLSDTTQENIKVVKTQNMLPSKEILQLLNNYVPAMNTLVCGHNSPYDTPLADVALIDLTGFSNLSLVIIDIRLLYVDSPGVCVVEMEYSSKDRGYYLFEMNDDGLALKSVTIKDIEEQKDIIRSTLIKCDIHVNFEFYFKYTRVANIINGNLIPKNEVFCDSYGFFMF
ncbi:uncharacterized protein EV154DRAFT_499873 [Mucor mucedo]|uniref:uncharacterized protein n=1 Tax=Mucor mucedo TaxID=29922 RepID=UPI0022202791|nr:uncharacterized protein EV154DRAFT_499873 [Mucor mucedo]KAI7893998.1 hypothetical protein EV154DRAFT_499873 [Mucor mucedo]